MGDNPTQTFVVQLPSGLARRVSAIVDPGGSYESVSEFVRVAVENQLVLDASGDLPVESAEALRLSSSPIPTSSKAGSAGSVPATGHAKPQTGRSKSSAVSRRVAKDDRPHADLPTSEELLRLPSGEFSVISPMDIAGKPLLALTNRLSPLIVGPRVLANLTSASGSAPKIETFTEAGARAARDFGLQLRDEDDLAERRGRFRRSTAWPVGNDEAKSLIRYRSSFMLSSDGKGVNGPLIEFRLVAVESGRVHLTESGAAMASERIPARDDADDTDLMTDKLRRLLAEALVGIPGEVQEIRLFLEAMEHAAGAQDEIDRRIAKGHDDWSDAQVVSHRAAMIGRLRDLAVLEVDTVPKTKVSPGVGFGTFIKLLDDPQAAVLTGGVKENGQRS